MKVKGYPDGYDPKSGKFKDEKYVVTESLEVKKKKVPAQSDNAFHTKLTDNKIMIAALLGLFFPFVSFAVFFLAQFRIKKGDMSRKFEIIRILSIVGMILHIRYLIPLF